MTPAALGALLDTATEKAPALREAGVLYVEVGDVKMHLSPPAVSLDLPGAGDTEPPKDPWNDPATYGSEDGSVPGFERARGNRSRDEGP